MTLCKCGQKKVKTQMKFCFLPHSNLFENIDESSPPPNAEATPATKTNDDSTTSKISKRKRTSFGDIADAHLENTNQHLGEIVKCMKLMVEQAGDVEHKEKQMSKEKEKDEETEKQEELHKIYQELQKIGVPQHRLVRAYLILGATKTRAGCFFLPHRRIV